MESFDEIDREQNISSYNLNSPRGTFRQRINFHYNKKILVLMAINYLNDGLIPCRILSFRTVFALEYKIEPEQFAIIAAIAFLPWTMKFFWGLIVDLHFFKTKYYLIFFSLLLLVSQITFGLKIIDSKVGATIVFFIINISISFIDSFVAKI